MPTSKSPQPSNPKRALELAATIEKLQEQLAKLFRRDKRSLSEEDRARIAAAMRVKTPVRHEGSRKVTRELRFQRAEEKSTSGAVRSVSAEAFAKAKAAVFQKHDEVLRRLAQ